MNEEQITEPIKKLRLIERPTPKVITKLSEEIKYENIQIDSTNAALDKLIDHLKDNPSKNTGKVTEWDTKSLTQAIFKKIEVNQQQSLKSEKVEEFMNKKREIYNKYKNSSLPTRKLISPNEFGMLVDIYIKKSDQIGMPITIIGFLAFVGISRSWYKANKDLEGYDVHAERLSLNSEANIVTGTLTGKYKNGTFSTYILNNMNPEEYRKTAEEPQIDHNALSSQIEIVMAPEMFGDIEEPKEHVEVIDNEQ